MGFSKLSLLNYINSVFLLHFSPLTDMYIIMSNAFNVKFI
jgi:hypothetical protein